MPEPSALPFPSSSPPSNDSSLEMEKQDPIRGRMPAISGACTVNCASSDSIKVFIWSQDGTIAQISGEIAQMFASNATFSTRSPPQEASSEVKAWTVTAKSSANAVDARKKVEIIVGKTKGGKRKFF